MRVAVSVVLAFSAVLIAWANTRLLLMRLRGTSRASPIPLASLLLGGAAAVLWPRPATRFLVFGVPALLDLPLHALLFLSWARARLSLPR
jgi:hypothetical protein